MSFKITFIGATETVTGSKYLLEVDQKKYLVDCGLFQGLKDLRLKNWDQPPFDPKSIDAVILTHAHIDHSGYIPLIVKEGFKGKIYCTEATKSLCGILLPDAGFLQEEDANFANKHKFSKHTPALPLYTQKDAIYSLSFLESVRWKKEVTLAPGISFSFQPAGHILGAAFIEFYIHGRKMVFSGDLGRMKNILMPPPASPLTADYLVVESTYGNRLHPKENAEDVLGDLIRQTIQRNGIVLIPAFAVGRAQELLFLIRRLKKKNKIPNVPVFLNSPMAITATQLFYDYVGEHTLTPEECLEMSKVAQNVSSVEESKKLVERTDPCIIISASGMATGGRVLHHLKALAPNPENLILFAGYQAMGTRGEAMVHGKDEIKIHGLMIPVRAQVASIDTLSAHADADEIIAWLSTFSGSPKMTFITHGEPEASAALQKRMEEELQWKSCVPKYLQSFDLE